MKGKKKVYVGLSGGVDSSVSAALLKKDGYDVTGVFIRVWHEDTEDRIWRELNFSGCTAADDRLDAMRVCAKLGIPFVELDLEHDYKREVVDYMIREYKAGKTPNPDVMCNRFIKFGAFYEWALRRGADFVATGHYARIGTVHLARKDGRPYVLKTGVDPDKDQSYFLWQIRREQLPYILFPVGAMRKPEVRQFAKKSHLITAEKKDSQGLCFIGKVDMKEFLAQHIQQKEGKILAEHGMILGTHNGAFLYTIGERIGSVELNLKVERKTGARGPLYVISKDMRHNTLTVSSKSPMGNLGGTVREVTLKKCNWLIEPHKDRRYTARVRYRQPLQKVRITKRMGSYTVRFDQPQTVASGQSLVAYDGDSCMGGGIIAD